MKWNDNFISVLLVVDLKVLLCKDLRWSEGIYILNLAVIIIWKCIVSIDFYSIPNYFKDVSKQKIKKLQTLGQRYENKSYIWPNLLKTDCFIFQ